jgi:hypothetical protein
MKLLIMSDLIQLRANLEAAEIEVNRAEQALYSSIEYKALRLAKMHHFNLTEQLSQLEFEHAEKEAVSNMEEFGYE